METIETRYGKVEVRNNGISADNWLIYKCTHKETSKAYIGKTRRRFIIRILEHLKNEKKKKKYHFQRALHKYGVSAFYWEKLDFVVHKRDLEKAQKELSEKEVMWVKSYDTFNSGYNHSMGGEGSGLVWTPETLAKVAKKYKTRKEFELGHSGAHSSARKAGTLNDICGHMVFGKQRVWSEEELVNEAKKYKTTQEFKEKSRSAYAATMRHGHAKKVCNHMPFSRFRWAKKGIAKEAKKYNTRSEFAKGSPGANHAAKVLGIRDKVCAHMTSPLVRWTKESLKKEAEKYKTRRAFYKGSGGAYGTAQKQRILDEVCPHMPKREKRTTRSKPQVF